MLRRISIALAGLMALGFLAASPAGAVGSDVHGCWQNTTHVQAGSVAVHESDAACWHVG